MHISRFEGGCLGLVLCLGACSRSTTPADGRVVDAAADGMPDSAGLDARAEASRLDAAGPHDAGYDALSPDASLSDAGMRECPAQDEPACDSGGQFGCYEWAYRVGAGYTDPTAQLVCFLGADGGQVNACERANWCGSESAGSCQCGRGPACTMGQVCARRSVTSPYECLPCRAD